MPNASLRAVAVSVPKTFVDGRHFAELYGAEESARIDRSAGLDKRPRLQATAAPIDLALSACRSVLSFTRYDPASIDTLIYLTQTPELIVPASACLLQQRLELPTDIAAFDVNLGCSGYVYGLFLASSLVKAGARRRVLLVVGDASSRGVDERDRSTGPLFGDAMSATIIEPTDAADDFGPFKLGTDGSGWSHLVQCVGQAAYRDRASFEKARPPELAAVKDGRFLHMNGEEIFSFTLQRVPGLVASLLKDLGKTPEQLDYYAFHQANKFILEQIRRKAKIPPERMLFSIGEYGNTSSASIPVTLCHTLRSLPKPSDVALVGFGVGYSWGATCIRLAPAAVGPITYFEP
jgi:3-oxoacyl-[acyl-carrier-protein] synthase-3